MKTDPDRRRQLIEKRKEALSAEWQFVMKSPGRGVLTTGGQDYKVVVRDQKYWFEDFMMNGAFLDPSDMRNKVVENSIPTLSNANKMRKDFNDLTAEEKTSFADAMNWMQAQGRIRKFADGHSKMADQIHWVPQFLPWHRWMLWQFEQELMYFDPDVRLPYWDTSRDENCDFESGMLRDFFGGRENKPGPFSHWDINRAPSDPFSWSPSTGHIRARMTQDSFKEFRRIENNPMHTWAHDWVGGYMTRPWSPRDPLFYLHHTNLDRLWAIWQINNPDQPQYTSEKNEVTSTDSVGDVNYDPANTVTYSDFLPVLGIGSTLVPGPYHAKRTYDMLDHRALGYYYPQDNDLETELNIPGFVGGDQNVFMVSPGALYIEDTLIGEKAFGELLLHNMLEQEIVVEIEASPAVQGVIDGLVWNGMSRKFLPDEIRTFPVSFSPQNSGQYEGAVKVRLSGVGFTGTTLVRKVFAKGVN